MEAIVASPASDSPEISQIDGIFALAFPAKSHFMSGNIGEYLVDEKAAERAMDLPKLQICRFQSRQFQPVELLGADLGGVSASDSCIHRGIASFPSPISNVMYSSALRFL